MPGRCLDSVPGAFGVDCQRNVQNRVLLVVLKGKIGFFCSVFPGERFLPEFSPLENHEKCLVLHISASSSSGDTLFCEETPACSLFSRLCASKGMRSSEQLFGRPSNCSIALKGHASPDRQICDKLPVISARGLATTVGSAKRDG